MRFEVHAVPAAQFSAWASAAHSGPPLDAKTFAQLQKPSSYVKPFTYGSVLPNLFESLVANRNPNAHFAGQCADCEECFGLNRR